MKLILITTLALPLLISSCGEGTTDRSVNREMVNKEQNQINLNAAQPAPDVSWSQERENLIKRFKLENDRGTMFYLYLFIEGIAQPIGYYQVNKVSSVNSQLTNTQQFVDDPHGSMEAGSIVMDAPAEDGSYGSNGEAVFGFTPEEIYIEHNLKYIVATVPLSFPVKPNLLTIINLKTQQELTELMKRIDKSVK